MGKITHRERQKAWDNHVKAWRDSGKTMEAYCEEHGIKTATFKVKEREARYEDDPKRKVPATANMDAFWERHVRNWQKSAETMYYYCQQQGLDFVTFQKEKEKLEIRLGRGLNQPGPELKLILRDR